MSLRLELGWDRQASTGDSEHWLAVTLRGLARTEEPASFAVLVDTSTSMLGSRLAHAREAIAGLVRACGTKDHLIVYAFGSAATPVLDTPGGVDVGASLVALTASGKTRLDLALRACETWIRGRPAPRYIVVLTDGDPTDAEGRRADVEPILVQARALGAVGVRTSVIGIGSAEGYDGSFLRSLADAGGGPSAIGVAPTALAERLLSDLRGTGAAEVDLALTLDSDVLSVVEAWRAAPRVQPLTATDGRVPFSATEGGTIGLRLRCRAPLASGRGARGVGTLRVRQADGREVEAPLTLNLVAPSSPELTALEPEVDKLRVRIELARTAQLRSATENADDQLRHTRRLSELVDALGDPRATARIGEELTRLADGMPLGRAEREETVDLLRDWRGDA